MLERDDVLRGEAGRRTDSYLVNSVVLPCQYASTQCSIFPVFCASG